MSRTIFRITLFVLVVAGIAWGKRDFNFDKKDIYPSEQVEQIDIDVPYGNLEIYKSPSGSVEVYFRHIVFADDQDHADDINRELNYKIEHVGDRLMIEIDRDHSSPSRKEFWKKLLEGDNKNSQVLLKVLLPDNKSAKINSASCDIKISDLSLNLDLNSASSNVNLENTSGEISCDLASGDVIIGGHDGNIKIESASSDLQFKDINGNLRVSVASGNIEVDKIDGDMEVESSSGDIRAYSVVGNVDLSTTSGTIFAEDISGSSKTETVSGDITMNSLKTIDGQIEASSVSGQIRLEINPNFSGEVEISSISGDVNHSFDGNFRMLSGNRVTGNIGNGQGSLNISSTSGDIIVDKY